MVWIPPLYHFPANNARRAKEGRFWAKLSESSTNKWKGQVHCTLNERKEYSCPVFTYASTKVTILWKRIQSPVEWTLTEDRSSNLWEKNLNLQMLWKRSSFLKLFQCVRLRDLAVRAETSLSMKARLTPRRYKSWLSGHVPYDGF